MQAQVNGTVSGIGGGDSINQIEIVWKTSSVEVESTAAAVGRGITLTSNVDKANFSQTTVAGQAPTLAGYQLISVNLVQGTTYWGSVRITENKSGGGTQTGAWSTPTSFVAGAVTTTITFETNFGPYTNEQATLVSLATDQFHSGTHSAKFLPAVAPGPYARINKAITLPASGNYVFERWFRYEAATPAANLTPWSICTTAAQAQIGAMCLVHSGAIDNGKISTYTNGWGAHNMSESVLSPNTWYRLVVTLHLGTTDNYDLEVYNSTGTRLTSLMANNCNYGNIHGTSMYLCIGGYGTSSSGNCWIDDMVDGL